MSRIISFCFITLILLSISANANEFEQYLSNQNQAYLKTDDLFETEKAKQSREFEKYRKKILTAYRLYKLKIAKYWGKNNTVISDRRQWAEYDDDMKQRQVVDFKTGKVKVEILLDKHETGNTALIQKKLKKAIVLTVTKAADQRSILEIAKSPAAKKVVQSKNSPVLEGQVKLQNGELVNSVNAQAFADEVTKKSLSIKSQQGDDGVERVIATSRFNLVPNHIRLRAERFKSSVKKYAKKYTVSQNLVYAVIETESFFNPTARSNVPAFGLMQLVPYYGAREAYHFVHKTDHIPSDHYLYDPDNNIQLGSAYLHILYFTQMNEIKDNKARLWCSIAAYNTGPTNVYSAVIGKYKRSHFRKYAYWKAKAVKELNKMDADQVYQLLRQKLPFKETRSYIKKVRSRMGKYSSM